MLGQQPLTLPGNTNRVISSLMLLILLAGCSQLEQQATTSIDIFSANRHLEQWQINGRVGIQNRDNANSAYLQWRQCGDKFDIRMNGPLGQGAVKLVGDNKQTTLIQSDGSESKADSPEQLMQQELGWQLPVSQMQYWVRGVPEPNSDLTLTETGFIQNDWQLDFPQQATINTFALPTKTIARYYDLKVTLLSRQWNLQPNCGVTQ